MSEEKTPEQVAQEAQDSLNKIISTEAQKLAQQTVSVIQLRQIAVQLAVELTKRDEALFAGGMLEYADRIFKYMTTGVLSDKPLKD